MKLSKKQTLRDNFLFFVLVIRLVNHEDRVRAKNPQTKSSQDDKQRNKQHLRIDGMACELTNRDTTITVSV